MIPLDTAKTRIVTQTVQAGVEPYRGIISTLGRVAQEEGVGALYRSLVPRLVSVMPMMGIQVRRRMVVGLSCSRWHVRGVDDVLGRWHAVACLWPCRKTSVSKAAATCPEARHVTARSRVAMSSLGRPVVGDRA